MIRYRPVEGADECPQAAPVNAFGDKSDSGARVVAGHPQPRDGELARALGLCARPPRRGRRLLWRAAMATIIVAGSAWTYVHLTKPAPACRYVTRAVERGDIVVTVVATGTLEPTNQVDVGSELSGVVRSVDADFNDAVTRGQTLATLDTSRFATQVAQSKAALQLTEADVLRAAATLEEAKFNYERINDLSRSGSSSEAELVTERAAHDRAVADEAAARARVAQAQAALDTAETDLAKTVITSPIDGIVLRRTVESGQTVAASFQAPVLFTIAEDLRQMELQVDIDEADISRIEPGQPASFTVDAHPGRAFEARIMRARYGSESTGGVVTYETMLLVDNADLSLRPGMTATATITVTRIENELLVPNAALRFQPVAQDAASSGGLLSLLLPKPPGSNLQQKNRAESTAGPRQVWILEDGQATPLTVQVDETDGTRTVVRADGLSPGVQVIVDVVPTGS